MTTDLNRPISDTLLPVLQLLHHDSVVCPVQPQRNSPTVPQLESSTEIMAYASSYWRTRNLGALPLAGAPRLRSPQRVLPLLLVGYLHVVEAIKRPDAQKLTHKQRKNHNVKRGD
jgi:hypothetical protein